MPFKNGIDVVKEIRHFYREISTRKDDIVLIEPIYIFLTTFGESKSFEDFAYQAGVDHVFKKPLDSQQLQIVSDLLGQ